MPNPPRISAIQAVVADVWGVDLHGILSDRRGDHLTEPRHAAMYLAANLTRRSLADIGRAFRRDHTSVRYAIKATTRRLSVDATGRVRSLLQQATDRLAERPEAGIELQADVVAAIDDLLDTLRVSLLDEARRDPAGLVERLRSSG